jgi:hypothetical protein
VRLGGTVAGGMAALAILVWIGRRARDNQREAAR